MGKKKLDLNPPPGLSEREFHAFRLGVLKSYLITAKDLGHDTPGIFRESFTNEIRYREYHLKAEGA